MSLNSLFGTVVIKSLIKVVENNSKAYVQTHDQGGTVLSTL